MNPSIVLIATIVGMFESMMFMFCGFRLIGFTPSVKTLGTAGVIHALLVRLSRHIFYTLWGIPFGAHMVVALVLFFAIAYWLFRLPAILAVTSTILGFMILLLGTTTVLMFMPDITPVGLPSVFLLIVLEQLPLVVATVIIWKTNFSIVSEQAAKKLGITGIRG